MTIMMILNQQGHSQKKVPQDSKRRRPSSPSTAELARLSNATKSTAPSSSFFRALLRILRFFPTYNIAFNCFFSLVQNNSAVAFQHACFCPSNRNEAKGWRLFFSKIACNFVFSISVTFQLHNYTGNSRHRLIVLRNQDFQEKHKTGLRYGRTLRNRYAGGKKIKIISFAGMQNPC